MRYLVISDIHANLEALEATLQAAGPYDRVLVLGDLVGYGADPNAVIDRVRALPASVIIRGNHDKVAAGLVGVQGFNTLARQAVEWTAGILTPEHRAWLAALPSGPATVDDLTEICHGTPFDEDVYVFEDMDALRSLHAAQRPLCLFGHTHVPAIFTLADSRPAEGRLLGRPDREFDGIAPVHGSPFQLDLDGQSRYLVNCGAVGQPRDGDARAAHGLLDTEARSITIVRTPYDVAAAQAKIVQAGLPEVLARRLAAGR
ncbi:MAG: metallophosphoesterase [Acidobacteria bacterium]|nr:metallophosphoesterase [Acidobacteriota bacterium]